MMNEKELNEIKARCEAATAAKWESVVTGYATTGYSSGEFYYRVYAGDESISDEVLKADADFIAHARTDVPALVAEVERLQTEFSDADRTATKLIAENIALEAHNSVLMSALEDMLLLIEEHGIKSVIRFHAKRIAEARKALRGNEWIFDENPFIPDSNGFLRGGEG